MVAVIGPLTLRDSSPGELEVYTYRNVLIVCWLSLAGTRSVARLKQARAGFATEHPEGYSVIHLLGRAGEPDSETRSSLVDMIRNYSEHVACVAVLTLGGGFHASTARSRVTGMQIEAPAPSKLGFHSSVEDVVAWLLAQHEEGTGVRLAEGTLTKCLQRGVDSMLAANRSAE